MDLRQHPRYPVQCGIAFSGDDFEGEGTVMNLSKGGWRITSNQIVPKGEYLALRVRVPDHEVPLEVDLAAVRWSSGQEFGLEFIRMKPEEQERHNQFINTLTVD